MNNKDNGEINLTTFLIIIGIFMVIFLALYYFEPVINNFLNK